MTVNHHRTCGDCTACCDGWLRIEVTGFEAYPGKPCQFSSSHGCLDYDHRPEQPCRQFECVWLTDKSLPDWMKPSNAGAILIPKKFNFADSLTFLAVPTGESIPPNTLSWIKQFAESKQTPLIFFDNEMRNGKYTGDTTTHAHGPIGFQKLIREKIKTGEINW